MPCSVMFLKDMLPTNQQVSNTYTMNVTDNTPVPLVF